MSVVRAGLERDVSRCPACCSTGRFKCVNFGVRGAGALMPAFTDYMAIFDDHAADARIGGSGEHPQRRKLQRTRHVGMVDSAESIGGGHGVIQG